MLINDKIEQIKSKINYDFNRFVRDTLFPIDKFVKRATEEALRTIGRECRIVEKSVFIPLVDEIRWYDITLSTLTKDKFSISQTKDLSIYNNENGVIDVAEVYIEEVIQGLSRTNNLDFASKIKGTEFSLQSFNQLVDISEGGTYEGIATIVDSDTITIADVNNAAIGQCIINLDKADIRKYDYRIITGISGTNITVDSVINENPSWTAGEKIYICDSLPYLMLFTFQGVPEIGYFDTQTTIPIQEQFLDLLDHFIVANLYAVLIARDEKMAQKYMTLINSGVVLHPDKALTRIKVALNSKFGGFSAKLYNPIKETISDEPGR